MQKLQDGNMAYPCFCSPEELDRQRQQCAAAKKPPRYLGKCNNLTAAQVRDKILTGESAVWRFCMPSSAIVVRDIVRGELRFDGGDIGDFIIRRANGDFSFIFINAVDDAADGITCVLRGEDHLPNLPRQLAILNALDLPPPQYGHLPLMTDLSGKPLSKRGGAPSLRKLREEGYLPLALMNYLARVGHKYGENAAMTAAELAKGFSLDNLSHSAARFDGNQLLSRQRESLHNLSAAEKIKWLSGLAPPQADSAGFAKMIMPNVAVFADVRKWAESFTNGTPDDDAAKVIGDAGSDFYTSALVAHNDLANGEWRAFCDLVAAKTGLSGRRLFMPLRAALTGKTYGPEMAAFFALLPHKEQQRRLRDCADFCDNSG